MNVSSGDHVSAPASGVVHRWQCGSKHRSRGHGKTGPLSWTAIGLPSGLNINAVSGGDLRARSGATVALRFGLFHVLVEVTNGTYSAIQSADWNVTGLGLASETQFVFAAAPPLTYGGNV